ncbi:hypothetical protein ACKXGF_04190 [Alkalibacillus sp. S2W]|uniref:hypothetical protein n=1 Tax=Alkalibacillus sp. S2W TaxID=3386553 RepID=UPI00398D0501
MVRSEGGDSCGNSTCLETPQEVLSFRGGSSRARGKRPPTADHNSNNGLKQKFPNKKMEQD